MPSLPAIPEPSTGLSLEAVEDVSQTLIKWAPTAEPEALVERLDQGLALERFLKKRRMAGPMQIADRHMERALGVHLGDPVHGRPRKKLIPITLSADPNTDHVLKSQFRLIAKWWVDIVGQLPLTRAAAIKIARGRQAGLDAVDGLDLPEIHITDCRDLMDIIGPQSVDVIVTDPPYADLGCYAQLGEMAMHVLRPGGLCWAMSGQTHLPAVLTHLGDGGLSYYWTVAYLTQGGPSTNLWQRKVTTFWKPVLVFAKPGADQDRWFGDVARSDDDESDAHPEGWAQSESGFTDLIKRASEPGWVVCDPFVGTGTAALVATKLGRRFVGGDANPQRVEQARRRLGLVS